jgi:hypothetical protein
MGPDHASKFRCAGPLGSNGLNDLSFNELGGSRVPGSTGTKTPPPPTAIPTPKSLASNDGGVSSGKSDAGLPPPGPPIASATSAGDTASPNSFHSSLAETERGVLWQGILRGDSFDQTFLSLKILRGNGHTLSLKLTSKLSTSPEEEFHLSLLDSSFVDPTNVEFTNEVKELHRQYVVLTMHEFWELKETIAANFERGWFTYHELRHLYVKAGYSHPPTELNKIRSDVTFLENTIVGGVHPELAAILKAAESRLSDGGPLSLNACYRFPMAGFVPRAISDDKSNLSNHALGKAVDIDAANNPQFSKNEAVVLDRVLGWLKKKKSENVWWLQNYNFSGPYSFSQSMTAASLPDGSTAAYRELEQNSLWIQAFLRDMYPMRRQLKASADQARKYEKSIHSHDRKGHVAPAQPGESEAKDDIEISDNLEHMIGALHRATPPVSPEHAIKHGIIALPPQIFTAMAEAGARSGLDPSYKHKKDSMHFEVSPKTHDHETVAKKAKKANK